MHLLCTLNVVLRLVHFHWWQCLFFAEILWWEATFFLQLHLYMEFPEPSRMFLKLLGICLLFLWWPRKFAKLLRYEPAKGEGWMYRQVTMQVVYIDERVSRKPHMSYQKKWQYNFFEDGSVGLKLLNKSCNLSLLSIIIIIIIIIIKTNSVALVCERSIP